MNYELIKNFVTVANTMSITHSSQILFVSQSTVSHRLQLLESALGQPLINRGRGKRAATLTQQGKAFLPIAEKWLALWQETDTFRNAAPLRHLRIACVGSLMDCYLSSFVIAFSNDHPDVRISMQTLSSQEVYTLLGREQLDIGIVLTDMPRQGITVRPLLSEEMVLVSRSSYFSPTDTAALDPDREIYLNWGVEFELWHDRHFPTAGRPRLYVNDISMIESALLEWNCWSVVPQSVAQLLESKGICNTQSLKEPPPRRISYVLTSNATSAGISDQAALFLEELSQFLPAVVKYSN